MYLKKITAVGFKSFADRVTIKLDKNQISGIVGPNGSGKSNVIDSVRWVMGEQNAKMLRGEKATDIIFAGSQKRKQMAMAEVSLVFDNAEASPFCPPEYRHEPEVSLTRRLYLDGEREYLINKKPCRLKDIIGFFTASGLGGRSYSMIQQGQVDRILQAKPEQIREILEEASGTLVFKKRRDEAERKLENTRVSLSRIDDLLKELGDQKATLETQVKKARKYQESSEKLKTDELELFAHTYAQGKDQLSTFDERVATLQDQQVAGHVDQNHAESELARLQEELAAADPDLQRINEEISKLREQIASSETSLVNLMQLLQTGDQRLASLKEEKTEVQAEIEQVQEKIELHQKELEDIEQLSDGGQDEDLEMELENVDEQLLVFASRREELMEQRRQLERELDQVSLKIENTQVKFAETSREMEESQNKIIQIQSELSQIKILVYSAQVKVHKQQAGCDSLSADRKKLTEEISENEENLSHEQGTLAGKQIRLAEVNAKIAALEEILASGNSNLIADLKNEAGVEFTYLPDQVVLQGNQTLMSESATASLSQWLNRVAVRTWQELDHLEKATLGLEKGSITASVLSNLPTSSAGLESHGLAPIAPLLTTEDQALKPLLMSLWYDSSSSSSHAAKILASQGIPATCTIINQAGSTFHSSTETKLGKEQGVDFLRQKQSLEDLLQEREDLQSIIDEVSPKIETFKSQINQAKDLLLLKEEENHQANQDLLRTLTEFERAKDQLTNKETALVELNEYLSKHHSSSESSELLNDLEQKRENINKKLSIISSDVEELYGEEEDIKERRHVLQQQAESFKIASATIDTRKESAKRALDQRAEQLTTLMTRYQKFEKTIQDINDELTGSEQKKADLESSMQIAILQRDGLEESQAGKREANAGIVEAIKVQENKKKEIQDTLNKSQKELHEIDLKKEKIRIDVQNSYDETIERYNKDLDKMPFERKENFNRDNAAKKVSRLRQTIESMGPVNMMAVEEYDKISERESFILAQRNEVVSSVELLELAIEEIEESSESKFHETFKVLNREFSELFPILFPGGHASLELTGSDKPLEAGVEILVQLPGKKRQNMRLFSGGEKALTAIALIFALLKSKPTPFCFLDEVDAPLDETNVGRYNKVLEALSDRFQFIVITHNRRTMEVLDTLYGVTMQEPGVSKVVGVDMTQDIPEHLKKAFKDKPSPRQGAALG